MKPCNLNDKIWKAITGVILAAIFGGGISVFGKIGLKVIPPFTFTFFRFFIASLLLLPFVLKTRVKFTRRSIMKAALVSFLAVGNVTLFAFGVRLTSATVSQLLYTVVPIFAVILSYVFLHDKITVRKLIGVFLGFIGTGLIIILPIISRGTALESNFTGNMIVLAAVVSFSFYSVFSKRVQVNEELPPLIMTFVFTSLTASVLAGGAVYEYLANPLWVGKISVWAVLATLYVGIFGGTFYYLLYQYAIKHGNPVIASMTLFIQPVATYLWAVTLLGEKLTPGIIIGSLLTFAGAYVVTLMK